MNLECDEALSNFAFKVNLRRYILDSLIADVAVDLHRTLSLGLDTLDTVQAGCDAMCDA